MHTNSMALASGSNFNAALHTLFERLNTPALEEDSQARALIAANSLAAALSLDPSAFRSITADCTAAVTLGALVCEFCRKLRESPNPDKEVQAQRFQRAVMLFLASLNDDGVGVVSIIRPASEEPARTSDNSYHYLISPDQAVYQVRSTAKAESVGLALQLFDAAGEPVQIEDKFVFLEEDQVCLDDQDLTRCFVPREFIAAYLVSSDNDLKLPAVVALRRSKGELEVFTMNSADPVLTCTRTAKIVYEGPHGVYGIAECFSGAKAHLGDNRLEAYHIFRVDSDGISFVVAPDGSSFLKSNQAPQVIKTIKGPVFDILIPREGCEHYELYDPRGASNSIGSALTTRSMPAEIISGFESLVVLRRENGCLEIYDVETRKYEAFYPDLKGSHTPRYIIIDHGEGECSARQLAVIFQSNVDGVTTYSLQVARAKVLQILPLGYDLTELQAINSNRTPEMRASIGTPQFVQLGVVIMNSGAGDKLLASLKLTGPVGGKHLLVQELVLNDPPQDSLSDSSRR
ncbi:MAG: hypothetical protein DCC75_05345 [Proteobacteria bacterium]|nr:MAG: hypothetical protein DCC75_05345 [Pseudomonadota bacterium]